MQQTIAELKRYPVYNERGDRLGVIDDVIVDADAWRVCYAVLRYEPPGEAPKLLGVTLGALTLDSENECLVVSVEDEALRSAHGLSKEAPPQTADSCFVSPTR